MFRGDRERSGTGSVRVSRLRLLDRPRGEPGRMAPPASRAAQRESEPQVSHLPGRERRARPRGGGARGLGTLRDWSGGRGGLPRGSDRPLPSRGDGAALQVCSEGTVTQPTSSPTLPLGLKLGAPRCRVGGTRSSCCGRRAPESAAAARSAQRRAGTWRPVPGGTAAGPAAVGARAPPLPSALSLRARPPASPPPAPAPPPAPPLRGTRRRASRLQSPRRAGSREPPPLPRPRAPAPPPSLLSSDVPELGPPAGGAGRRCPWPSPRADCGRPTGCTAAELR